MYCIVRNCRSVWTPNSYIKFHSFPKDVKRKNTWLSIISIKGKFYTSARICSLHFKSEDYDASGRLRNNATPFYLQSSCDCVSTFKESYTIEPSTSTGQTNIRSESVNTDTISMELLQHESKENFLDAEYEPQTKRPRLKDFNIQVNKKTTLEISLKKSKKILQQKVRRQKQKINDMESLIAVVRKYTSQSEIENILQGNFSNICKAFNRNHKQKVIKYSDDIKAFALTVHFYSPKAYEFLRTLFQLPHSKTLWRSISSFDCNVGFLSEVLEHLKSQLPEKPHLKNVALIFDSMSLKKDIAYAPKLGKLFGYVDLGNIPVSEPEQLASEVLVYQIVSYSDYFKCPIGYFC